MFYASSVIFLKKCKKKYPGLDLKKKKKKCFLLKAI